MNCVAGKGFEQLDVFKVLHNVCETESDFEFTDINSFNCVEDNRIEKIQEPAQELIEKNP